VSNSTTCVFNWLSVINNQTHCVNNAPHNCAGVHKSRRTKYCTLKSKTFQRSCGCFYFPCTQTCISAYTHTKMRISLHAPGRKRQTCEFYRSLQNCWSLCFVLPLWSLEFFGWLLDFWKILGLLRLYTDVFQVYRSLNARVA
jgi:hypothetical protein